MALRLGILGAGGIGAKHAEVATEIIHIGQAVMSLGGTLEYFRTTVFNYPTMAECYKVAALDGLNKLAVYDTPDEVWSETPVSAGWTNTEINEGELVGV